MSINNDSLNPKETLIPEKPMRRLVITTLMIILLVLVIFVVTGLSVGPNRNITIILSFFVIVALTIAILGYPILGRIVAPFGVLIAFLFTAYYGDGLHDEILIGSPISIVLAGLLLGNWGSIIVSVCLAAGMAAIGLVEIGGTELSAASALTEYDDILVITVLVMAIALVQYLLIDRMNKTLDNARRNGEALTRSNRELKILQADLERRVNERTLQLNRRAVQLQASSDIGRVVSSINDLKALLESVTTLISERFAYYHVGVFLLDRAGENAILRAANSAGGRRMLEKGHSLPVGSKSIVGYVTQHREPRIALDVGHEATFFDNPELPQTRSEMALPLIAAGKLLGVLDVQSTEAGAFSKDDVSVLQVLADQVSIAIENSNLFAESRAALEASKRAYGELSREAWTKLLKGRPDLGYQVDSSGNILPVEGGWSLELIQTQREGQPVKLDDKTLTIPLKILDLPLGVVRLKKHSSTRDWTDREIRMMETLVGNLGEALESARLYEDTQRRAERERVAADISARIRESLDVEAVLQTAVVEMRRALHLDEITIRLGEGNGQTSA